MSDDDGTITPPMTLLNSSRMPGALENKQANWWIARRADIYDYIKEVVPATTTFLTKKSF